ncbi:MAG: hypothetical protein IPK19_21580 [Chloroflexi bacterium]|nr:hypothetical protein [Chloroflexota bacterium]
MIDRLRATRHALSDTRRVLQVTCRPYESFDAAIDAVQSLYVDFIVLSLRLRAARAVYGSLARSATASPIR